MSDDAWVERWLDGDWLSDAVPAIRTFRNLLRDAEQSPATGSASMPSSPVDGATPKFGTP